MRGPYPLSEGKLPRAGPIAERVGGGETKAQKTVWRSAIWKRFPQMVPPGLRCAGAATELARGGNRAHRRQ